MIDPPGQNPYQSPVNVADDPNKSRVPTKRDLRWVARWHRVLIFGTLLNFVAMLGVQIMPAMYSCRECSRAEAKRQLEESRMVMPFVEAAAIAAIILSSAAAAMVVAKVCHPLVGLLLVLLTLIPCLGLFSLYSINQRATIYLRNNGVHVGFFGANPHRI